MDTLGIVLSAIVATILIIGAVVGVVVFVKGSYGKARMLALREDNEDLRARIDDMKEELATCKGREDLLEEKVTSLTEKLAMAQEMVTQRADVDKLVLTMQEQHGEQMSVLGHILVAIEGQSNHA